MSRRFLALILLALTALTVLAVLSTVLPEPASAATVYMDGDWTIGSGDDITYDDDEIHLNGNLTVEDGGMLTLRSCTLKMNSTASQMFHVEVQDGGRLNVYDGDSDDSTTSDASVITANFTSYNYAFNVRDGGSLYLNDSVVEECGVSSPLESRGLFIESSSCYLRDATIRNCYYGIAAYFASPTIEGCTVSGSSVYGIYLYTSSTDVKDCTISDCSYGVIAYYGVPKVTDTDVDTVTQHGIYIYNAQSTISGCTISDSNSGGVYTQYGTVSVTGTEIDDADLYGIISYYTTMTVSNCDVDGSNYGVYYYRNAAGSSLSSTRIGNSSSRGLYLYLSDASLSGLSIYDSSVHGAYIYRHSGTFTDSVVEDASVAVYLRDSSTTVRGVDAVDATTSGFDVSGNSPSVSDFSASNCANGIAVSGSADTDFDNGTIQGSSGYDVDVTGTSTIELANVSFSATGSRVQTAGSLLRRFWFVQLHATWQDGSPVAGGTYDVVDSGSSTVASGTLDGSGWARWLRIRELEMNDVGTTTDTPHTFSVTSGGLVGAAATSVDASKTVTVNLVDNQPPTGYVMDPEPAYTQGSWNTVSWTAGSDIGVGGIEYSCQLATDAGFSTVVLTTPWQSGTSYTFSGLADGVTYHYRVHARDGVGNVGAWSAGVSSTQDSSPPTIPVVVPEPAYTQGTSNTVSWGTSTDSGIGGVEYQLQVTDDPTFNTVLATVGWISTTSRTFAGLSDGTTYYYRVRARDAFGQTSMWSFPTGSTQDASAPSVPNVVNEPTYTAGLSNTIEWAASADAGAGGVEYYVEYDTQFSFPSPDGSSGWISALSHTFNGLPEDTWLYYHVRARDALGQTSGWSALTWSRQDGSPPAVPVITAEPTYTAGNSNTVQWAASSDGSGSGGVEYQAQADVDPAFGSPDFTSAWISVRSYDFSSLVDGATYYYRVRARDALEQESSWSSTTSSTQDARPPPVPSMAAEPPYTAGTTNTVEWTAVTDAGVGGEQYQLEASTSPVFTTVIGSTGWVTTTAYTASGLSDATTYYYRVRSRDFFGQVSDWSGIVASTQDDSPPPAPTMVQEGYYYAGDYYVAQWTSVSDQGVGGVEYYCEVDDVSNFASPNDDSGWIGTTQYNFTGLQESRWYYYHVKARDSLGQESPWSGLIYMRLDNTPPTVPTMGSEPTWTSGTSNYVWWSSSSDTGGVWGITYQVEIGDSPSFSPPLQTSPWQTSRSYTFTGLENDVTYYYHARARDGLLQESAWSAAVASTQDSAPPETPTMAAEPGYTPGTTNTVSWTAVTDNSGGTVRYQAQASESSVFATIHATTGWTTTNSYTFTGLTDGTTYYYRVHARDQFAQVGQWSNIVMSTQDASPPTGPTIVQEPRYTVGLSNTIEWSTSTDAGSGGVEYYVEYDTYSWFPSPDGNSGWISTTSYTFTGLPEDTWLYYHVRARDSAGMTTGWSSYTYSRQDNTPPSVPAMSTEPEYTAGNSNTVYWSASSDGAGSGNVQYLVQADTDALFRSPDFASEWTTLRAFTFGSLVDGTRYHYRVKAKDDVGLESSWSSTASSTQDASPPPVPSLAAEPPYTAGTTNTVEWTEVEDEGVGNERYQLEASTSPVFSTILGSTGWVTTTSYTASGLQDGETYYYRVRSRDGFGQESQWSSIVSSTQDASPPPAPSMIADGYWFGGDYYVARWTAVSDQGVGGVEYYCEVDDVWNFPSPNDDSGWTGTTQHNFTNLQENRWYYFHVKARDALDQESPWSPYIYMRFDNTAPTVPTMASEPTYTAGTSNYVSWSSSTDTGGIWQIEYQVEVGTSPSFSPALQTSPWQTSRGYTFTGLEDAVTYYYHARARDGLGHVSAWSAVVASTQDAAAPPAPTMADEPDYTQGTSNTLSWTAVTDNSGGTVEYEVVGSTSSVFATVDFTSGWRTATSRTFTGLTDGTRYYYRVHARDQFGQVGSWSNIVSSTQDATAPTGYYMLSEPTYTQGTSNTVEWHGATDTGSGGVEYQCEVWTLGDSGWITATSHTFTGLPENTYIYYHVRARDAVGNTGGWSSWIYSRQDASPPSVPTMAAEPTYTQGTTANVGWSASSDGSGIGQVTYQVQYAASGSFSPVLGESLWQSQRSYTFSGLADGQTYYFRARARDGLLQESGWSGWVSTTMDSSAPPAPTMAAEPMYTQGTSNTVSWTAVADSGSGGVEYEVVASTSSVFSSIDATSGWTTATSRTFTGLVDGATYYYRAHARDALRQVGPWSNIVHSMQDATAPGAPAITTEPTFTEGTTNTLYWGVVVDAGSGGVEYYAEYDNDWQFRSPNGDSGWITATEHTFTGIPENTWFFYHVRARDAAGNVGTWSSYTWSRQDATAPTAPTMTAEPQYTAGTTNTVGWSSSSDPGGVGGITYKAEASLTSTFSTVLTESPWIGSRSWTFTGLVDGWTYYYRVRARDAFEHASSYSNVVFSTQDASAPTAPFLAAEPEYTSGTANTLSWSAVSDGGVGGVEYLIERSTSPAFTSVVGSGWITRTSHTFTGLADGVTYFYRVRARDGFGTEGAWSNVEHSTQDDSPPSTPNLQAEPTYTEGTSNTLEWTASTDAGVGGVEYWIEYDNDFGFRSVNGDSGWITATEHTFTGLAEEVWWFYRVRARDALGHISSWSTIRWSRQDDSPPSRPSMRIEPSYTPGTSNTVQWTAATDSGVGGVEYQVLCDNDAGMASPIYVSGWTDELQYTFAGLVDGVTYYYAVQARDAFDHRTTLSNVVASTQDHSPPSTPAMELEPEYTSGTSNTVSWSAAVDAGVGGEVYTLQWSTSSVFSTVTGELDRLDATSATVSGLADGTRYYWRVRARDTFAFQTPWSNVVWSTQDASPPPVPKMGEEPEFTEGTSNEVSWGAVKDGGVGGVEYYTEISTDGAFTNPLGSGWTEETSREWKNLADGSEYWYRVRARDAFGRASAWSAFVSSTQDDRAPPVPSLAAEPAYTEGTTNSLSWSAVTDAGVGGVTYEVQASTTGSFASLTASSGWVDGTGHVFSGLSDGVTYHYRVRAQDAFGHVSAWSAVRSSTQDASAPTQPSLAAEPDFTPGISNTVSWSASTDAGVGGVQYFLEVATDGAFSDIVTTSGWTTGTSLTLTGLLDGGTYYYRVRARDAFGHESPWSNVESSTQDASPPSTPAMEVEPQFTPGTDNTVMWSLSIDAGVGGVTYYVEWDTSPVFASPDGASGWVPVREWTFTDLPELQALFYHVRARDALGLVSPWSQPTQSIQDASPPTRPTLNELSEFTKGTGVALSWNPAVDLGVAGVEYWAEWDDDPSFATPGGGSGWVASATHTFDGLPQHTRLYFRVRARDAFDHRTSWSPAESTTLDATAPSIPYLASEPLYTQGTTNALTWSISLDDGIGNVEYRIQATTDPTWATVDKDSDWLRSTSHTFAALSDGDTYYYRVRARDAFAHESGWSPVVSSTQDDSAPPTPLFEAEPAYTVGTTNTLSWSEVADAGVGGEEYRVEWSLVSGFSTLGGASPWMLDTHYTFSDLPEGSVIYFRVRARDAFGQASSWSELAQSIQDDSAPQVPTVNAEDEYTKGSTNELSWLPAFDAGVGGVEYMAEASTDDAFSDLVASSPWMAQRTYTFSMLSDGVTYNYRVRSRDAFGHVSGWSSTASSTQDASAPQVAFTGLPAVVSSPVYTLRGTATDEGSGVATVELSFDVGETWEAATYGSGAWTYTWTGYGSGDQEVLLRATDDLGNIEGVPAIALLVVDLDAPEANITSPAVNDTLTGIAPVQGTALDPHIARYNLYWTVDDVDWVAIVEDQRFSVTGGTLAMFDTRFMEDGRYRLVLEVNDTSGRTTRTNVTVDLVNSDIEISPGDLFVSNPLPTDGDNITISATFRNTGTSTARGVRVTVTDGEVTLHEQTYDIGPGESLTVEKAYLVTDHDVPHTIRARAFYEDNPNDKGDSATTTFTAEERVIEPFFDTSEWTLFILILAVLVAVIANSLILFRRRGMVAAPAAGPAVTYSSMEAMGSDQIEWDDDSF